MSLVSFKRGTKSTLPSSGITDGELYFTTDTGELFAAGAGNNFTKVSDIVICATVNDLPIAGTEISTKLYYVTATNSLYKVKSGDWEPLGSEIFAETYTAGTGIDITSANVINHTNSITAGTSPATSGELSPGDNFTIPQFTYDAQGHITGVTSSVCTLPAGAGQGSVTNVTAGVGLATASGSAITTSGTMKAKVTSETPLDIDAVAAASTGTANRLYPVQIDNSGYLAVNVPWEANTNTITSINGQSTGAIVLGASDVGAVDANNVGVANGIATLDSTGKLTSSQIDIPVTSVNNQTGAVTLTASDVGAIASTAKGSNNGVAELDSSGKVPSAQLPSYVDDVIEGYYNDQDGKFYEESTYITEITPESGKIYIDLSTDTTYRWGGSTYAAIGSSLALGETSTTAYRGDRGKTAYDHATDSSRLTTAQSSGLYKFSTTAEGHIAGVTSVQASDITALGIPAQDTTYSVATTTSTGLMPALDGVSSSKYLKGDGTWDTPPDTTYSAATTSASGLMPALDGVSSTKYLKGDGTWDTPVGTTYSTATTSAAGLMPQLDGVSSTKYLKGDGTWDTPPDTTYSVATTTAAGLMPQLTGETNKYLRADGSYQIPPDTTYSAATTSAAGLMPALDGVSSTKYLKGDGTWDTPPNTTYENKSAVSGGTDVSLVTTGEKYTWNSKTSNTGTVTSVATGVGLSGGPITSTGTIDLALVSSTLSSRASNTITTDASRQYAVNLDSNGKLSVNVPWTATSVSISPSSTSQTIAASAYLTNYLAAELKTITIATSDWSSSTTTVSGKAYYTCSKSVTTILVAHPTMFLSVDTVPTESLELDWSNLKMVANTSNSTLTFYAETKPTNSLTVGIKGVI